MSSLHVIVIGAGTGGMCLAHGLRRAGISVAVYERHRTRADGVYGYRVGIDPTGNHALKECLPQELFDIYTATCARAPAYLNVLTERRKTIASFPLPENHDPVDSERSVSRMTLRQVLLTGMEDVVHFGKAFTHYERNGDGTVTAFFADGTSATGDLLVAADGTGSRVRKQYLPHAEVKDTGVIAISAKVEVTPRTRALLPDEVFNGISLTFAPKGQFCIWHVMEFKWDRDGTVKHGIGGNDAELIGRWPGLLYDNTRDYINWGFSASADKFPPDVMDLRGEELRRVVLDMTPTWHPDMRELFEAADPGSCFPIAIRTSVPIAPWKSTNVTLLGDAVHTMTPGHGVGANTALRDAMLLRRHLVAVRDGARSLLDAVGAYEAEMIPYGFARVADSLAQNGTNGADPLHRPFVGRAVLAANRTFFRATNHIPALRRKFLDDLTAYRAADA
ncbi:NAD(P)/FAD-dependent oxidoreductase [Streptosporangium sp. NPDC051023]|uniref:FAD-dependent oxidoreductase n=1 Tax=Streptosporangium sp. NPDC051023 TaxID=3155410 RepID=UPI00344C0520